MTSTKMRSNNLSVAQKSCANFTSGVCLGCMMTYRNGKLSYMIDSRLASKPCVVASKTCMYFETIVLPAVV
jgi:hypothetical protein